MPVFELVIHFEGVDMEHDSFCVFIREVLRKGGYSIGNLVPEVLDVKSYFRTPKDEVSAYRALYEKYVEILSLAEKCGLRYKEVSISGWCSGNDEFCKPYWNSLHKLRNEG